MVGSDAAAVLRAQFDAPRDAYLPRVMALYDAYDGNGRRNVAHRSIFWKSMVEDDDQLRQRMVFALSQIVVASDQAMGDKPRAMAYYMDALGSHAFGNYRDLLEAVTYTPAMGNYLTYRGNRRGDPETGRTPDENYAREIMQLFSIGLVELRMDGTPVLNADGSPKEVYTNEDIQGLARVFTGLDLARDRNDRRAENAWWVDMEIQENRHSDLEKTFLGRTIPAGTNARDSIDQALDIIFEHPNVAPFLSRQLIQRFTASSPDPSYVRRVASAFESGSFTAPDGTAFGTGERGDLEATLAAVLLDSSQWTGDGTIRNTTDLGKVREPVLNFIHWARAFDVDPVTPENEWTLMFNMGNAAEWGGQMPLASPSVFNFYRPGYVAPGTEAAEMDVTAPEFQLLTAGNRAGYVNLMSEYIWDDTYGPDREAASLVPDYSDELELANDIDALADHLDVMLLGGEMSADTRDAITDVLGDVAIRTDTAENTATDELLRVRLAVLIATTAPEYMVR